MVPQVRSCIASALLAGVAILCARAQVVDFEKERQPVVEIHTLWRFHTGDDPDRKLGWAKPIFDDSSWKLVRSDQPLSAQGYTGYGGTAWYRFQIVLPANHPPLALYIAENWTSYQVFADGRPIGQFGGLPPAEKAYQPGWGPTHPTLGVIIPIPSGIADGADSVEVAIRTWIRPDWASFYSVQQFEPVSIGDASLIADLRGHRWDDEFRFLSAENVLLITYLLASFAGLGLFLLCPGEIEYLWFAGAELTYAARFACEIYPWFHPAWAQGLYAVYGILMLLWAVCLSLFFVTLLKEPRGWLFRSLMASSLVGFLMFIPFVMNWMSTLAWFLLIALGWAPFFVFQILMLILSARRGNADARMLLLSFGIQYGVFLIGLYLVAFSGPGDSMIDVLARRWEKLFDIPISISVQDIADFLTQLSLLAILMLRFARTRRDEERFKSELEAARTVQQVLIPEEIPAIPGLALECVYKPAGQVGGDFFQIIPTPNNGALIIIGDVSGKGMPAAMAVSLLVGTVRTLAHYTHSPAEILTAMNLRMLGRSKNGFTTCLVLRLDEDGAATISNAGHLAPYQGSRELVLESGLPLGLSAGAKYTESSFHLSPGEELTLETDGVAEARAKNGELFGFERTASIAILSAQHIAATAQAFGQQDDITVLKIRRQPVLMAAPS